MISICLIDVILGNENKMINYKLNNFFRPVIVFLSNKGTTMQSIAGGKFHGENKLKWGPNDGVLKIKANICS